ncbi:hypothetical protein PV728_47950 [Streptomyces europaeiscabiei]|uniref:hypothetical protein n=1 Tax=Streptomyces europaeiscabiei TaxID=146819 RepID=UPI0029A12662|nr:hypothetical protein [Streptomyces europaeiscabiei]MDX3637784.1 hypothetical protein [Streptomyces europaeiscabiei]MDX3655596.1 hypothetical protein [Streptomyces europaeiscabiei]
MSARITLHCDTQWQYGNCPTQLLTDADTVTEARAAARAQGWVTHSNSRDMCASCSGRGPQPAGAVVAVLHPERT